MGSVLTILSASRSRKAVVLLGLILAVVAVVTPLVVIGQAGGPPPPDSRPPEPSGEMVRPPKPFVTDADMKALAEAKAILDSGAASRVEVRPGLVLARQGGPDTRGATITVGGIQVKLPEDAELGGTVASYGWLVEMPPGTKLLQLPAYIIVRGNHRAAVSLDTGEVEIQTAEVRPFQFLIDAMGKDKLLRYDMRTWVNAWYEWKQTGKMPPLEQLPGPWSLGK